MKNSARTSGAQSGFTLIEVIIVVAIIGILAAVAYPSYQESIRRSARADVQSDMMELAQVSERFFTANNRYDQTRVGAPFALPFAQSPRTGANPRYNINFVSAAPGQTYLLQAVPVGAQAADTCGTLSINQLGVTLPALGANNRPCW